MNPRLNQYSPQDRELVVEPADESPAYPYRLVITGEFETRNGIAWTGDLFYEAQKVATVTNEGNGGPNDYRFLTPLIAELLSMDARTAYPDAAEPEECFIGLVDMFTNMEPER